MRRDPSSTTSPNPWTTLAAEARPSWFYRRIIGLALLCRRMIEDFPTKSIVAVLLLAPMVIAALVADGVTAWAGLSTGLSFLLTGLFLLVYGWMALIGRDTPASARFIAALRIEAGPEIWADIEGEALDQLRRKPEQAVTEWQLVMWYASAWSQRRARTAAEAGRRIAGLQARIFGQTSASDAL